MPDYYETTSVSRRNLINYAAEFRRKFVPDRSLLESGYDYRVIEMLKTFWIQSYNSERKNGKYPPLKDIFVDYNNDNKLIIVIAAGENDDDTN